jgi:imidazolonepropionase-like amidohydrolase
LCLGRSPSSVIDGTGNSPQQQTTIIIRDGRIISIGDEANWIAQPEEQVTTLDLAGRYVLPGLIDCHVHLAGNGAPDSRLQGDAGWATLLMLKHAQRSLAAGITTVREVGGRHGLEFAVRRAIEDGLWAGPRMQLSGKLLSITSAGTEYYEGMYREADGLDEVRKAAREQRRHSAPGGDHVRGRRVRRRSLRSEDALGRFRCLKAFDDQPDAQRKLKERDRK